jgi:hypothetical protein
MTPRPHPRAAEAVAWLQRRRLSAPSAVSTLREINGAANLLGLFKHFFPAAFARQEGLLLDAPERLREAQLEFLRLVSRRFFYIPEVYYEDAALAAEELPVSYIPVDPFLPDWWNEDPGDLPVIFQTLLALGGRLADEAEWTEGVRQAVEAGKKFEGRKLDPGRLAAASKKAKGPLKYLALALDVLDHDTGNPWLDTSYDMPLTDAEWSAENVTLLAKAFREARRIQKKVFALDRWLGADAARTKELVALWSQALA